MLLKNIHHDCGEVGDDEILGGASDALNAITTKENHLSSYNYYISKLFRGRRDERTKLIDSMTFKSPLDILCMLRI